MPVSKNQHNTAANASVAASKQPAFAEHLRAEIRQVTRLVMEEIMREELSQFLGAGWGEQTPERKGYRNGFYTRDLGSMTGPIEDLKVPRDREGAFHSQAFERYCRYEPQVTEGLTQMFVSGTSTRHPLARWLRR